MGVHVHSRNVPLVVHDKQSKDISEPANGLRRSLVSSAPLDIWRNERLVFETLHQVTLHASVDKGSEEDKYMANPNYKKAERRAQMKKKKALTVENTPTPLWIQERVKQ
ncbi:hypothetical protein TNCV_4964891 [Trichonephila clavipes]|nr:hypothetical protein TNCV_4964891 [Trichonephila clavipes]